ncbi:hypothetical protein AXF42_Ash007851 [Apostasia shenzhenica]|uniref:Uncharacterized protein n=1 Tax=Apostasia shenzhenica TaxID=1088818 RepID=A0A2I0B5J3_9ASPA|nr:hypothetical protein AXF42_Ash007851 [Apostasia shenzhenica]
MALGFTRISCWLWGVKDRESNNCPLYPSPDFPSGFRETDSLKLPSKNGDGMRSSSRRIKRKWKSREERRLRIDRDLDMVIVPSDGGCFSGSDSDDSDWSIGWMEPHASDLQSDGSDRENSFAVLVPCYGRDRPKKTDCWKSHVSGTVNQRSWFSSGEQQWKPVQLPLNLLVLLLEII